jgi:ABC-type phosphate/phosphonate transport system substrate-binding protein
MSFATLPMYDLPEAAEATAELWHGLARHFRQSGIDDVPDDLTRKPELPAHWISPDLLFSQTCGYPLRHAVMGKLQLVATPCYDAAGCEGSSYRSILLVPASSHARSLAELRGARVAFNGTDSQSGYNALRFMVAPLAQGGRFFGEVVETGSHAASLATVAAGKADLAAIDCVSLALFRRYRYESVKEVRELCLSPAAPSLPYVTAGASDVDRVARLRTGLRAAMADPSLAAARGALLLKDIMLLPDSAYERIDEMEQAAIARGYPVLA